MNVLITPNQAKLLNTEVNGCQHPRNLLVLMDKIVLYCTGCGSDMGTVAGVMLDIKERNEKEEEKEFFLIRDKIGLWSKV